MSAHRDSSTSAVSLDLPRVTEIGVDAAYVLCADDSALARPGTGFAARLGVDSLVIPGTHMTMPASRRGGIREACRRPGRVEQFGSGRGR